MQNGSYETRKEQIEKEFLREMRRVLKEEGIGYFNPAQNKAMRLALRHAAMVGAVEERDRTLKLLAERAIATSVRDEITSLTVLKVLGYE